MSAVIRTRIVKIGDSQGVCIPKLLLEQSGIIAEVEIEAEGNQLTIRKAHCIRAGWDEAFADMAQKHDDLLLDAVSTTNWDDGEWEW
jgi:antitoxin MazE